MKTSLETKYIASFMIGVGSILNVAPAFLDIASVGTQYNDYANLKKDWQNVGSYLYKAMGKVDETRYKKA